jgi:hypothetical protein
MGFENGHLLKVVLQATKAGNLDLVHTLHYDLDDGGLAEQANDPQSLADLFRDEVIPAFAGLFDSGWSIQPVIVEDERDPLNPNDPRQAWTSGAAAVGTRAVASDGLPPGICGVATLMTDHIGRRARGRIFLGGTLTEDDQAGGGVRMDRIGVAWTAFLDAIPKQPDIVAGASGASAKWCVYSRTQRAANLDPYANAIQAYLIRPTLHYLRSRAA